MFYTFNLTDTDKASIVAALRDEVPESEVTFERAVEREELARRIERTSGEEDGLDAGARLLRAWYADRVQGYAEDILRACLAGEVGDLSDYVHELADGTDLVIYTYKASAVLFASDNEDAGEEELGEAPDSVEARAYFALRADIMESLASMVQYGPPEGIDLPEGFDLDEPDTWTYPGPETVDDAHGIVVAVALPGETGARAGVEWDVFRAGELVSSHELREDAIEAAEALAEELTAQADARPERSEDAGTAQADEVQP